MLEKTKSLAEVYHDVWSHQTYRRYAPGLEYIDEALEVLRPSMGASFIDFGCGTGKPAAELRKRGYGVVGIDLAENCLDDGIDIPFMVADLTKRLTLTAQFGFCTDVLEHIAPENIDDALLTIADCVKHGVFFSIAMEADQFGPMLIGKPLHLTIHDAKWWREKLGQFWPRMQVVSESSTLLSLACFADVKAFREGVKIEALCNTPDDVIFSHVATNSARDIPWGCGSEPGEVPCLIVGGGPSLRNTLAIIKQSAEMGCPVFALNAASKYLTENGVACWQIIIDPREHNLDLLDHKAAGHILASQCHPALFDSLSNAYVLGFHVAMEGIGDHISDLTKATLIGGGITSGLTALALAYTLGYRTIHLHGYDSSDADDGSAHAYAQDESRAEKKRLDCMFNGKRYRCSFAMYKQAEEFDKFSRMLADLDTVIHVHGEGLLPAIALDIAEKQNKCSLESDPSSVCYDLSVAPASYDFISWLIFAEMERCRRGAKEPLRVAFSPGPDNGFREDHGRIPIIDRQLMLDCVMRPALKLIGAIEDSSALHNGTRYNRYVPGPIVEAFKQGETVPQFKVPPEYADRVHQWLMQHSVSRPLVVTLREATHWPQRNSNLDAWLKFASDCPHQIIFIRDTEKAGSALGSFLTCPDASRDVLFRAALYERARCNFFVANGPGALAWFMPQPWLMFLPLIENYTPSTDLWMRKNSGFGRGEQLPWARPDQRIIWEADSYQAIRNAWDALRPLLDKET